MSALARVKVVCHRAGQGFMARSQQVAASAGSKLASPQGVESWYGLNWE